ncbi:MAG: MopE-related protein, partial [Gammaproteobacteria bacterium]
MTGFPIEDSAVGLPALLTLLKRAGAYFQTHHCWWRLVYLIVLLILVPAPVLGAVGPVPERSGIEFDSEITGFLTENYLAEHFLSSKSPFGLLPEGSLPLLQLASLTDSSGGNESPPIGLDPFQCYRTSRKCGSEAPLNQGNLCESESACGGIESETSYCKPEGFFPLTIDLSNRFETGSYFLRKALGLCNPADENATGINDAVTHLRAYDIQSNPDNNFQSGHSRQLGLRIENEFHPKFGDLVVDTVQADALLVPSAKSHDLPISPLDPSGHAVDNFQCYQVVLNPFSPFFPKNLNVAVDDQFHQPKVMRLVIPSRLCVPVALNGGQKKNPGTDLMCYRIQPEASICSSAAPLNAGGACRTEQDCGGTRKTSFCLAQRPHIKVSGLHTANEIESDETFSTIREEELCVPSRIQGQDDSDGDGFTVTEGDCNDNDPNIRPNAPEVCGNLIDDDCDGEVDDVAECAASCQPGEACQTGVPGLCGPGQVMCPEDASGEAICQRDNLPVAETCDGLDNDCDGETDETLGQTTCGLGVCGHTVDNCVAGQTQSCDPLQGAALESCDGLDNDCDGATDETLGETTCGLGVCSHTVDNCIAGQSQSCDPLQGAGAEICDGLDNDCNGAADEGLGQTTCGLGVCSHTVDNCIAGQAQSCDPLQGAGQEICDGLDNNCDGATDEGLGQTTCGLGVCSHTVDNCIAGQSQSCDPLQGAALEICDGLDNNCDGATDEGLGQTSCGVGACERTVANCSNGVAQLCMPGEPVPENCDNDIDDDCDGVVNQIEACPNQSPLAQNDAYAVRIGETLSVPAPGVLANDSDPEHDPLTVALQSNPANGLLAFNPDGSFSYTPNVPSPTAGSLNPVVKFNPLDGVTVIATPLVANLTDDNGDGKVDTRDVPDIIVNTANEVIRAFSGDDGRELFSTDPAYPIAQFTNIALGDINGDGFVEFVASHLDQNHLVAFDHTGAFLWLSDAHALPGRVDAKTAISIANLDGSGPPEIIAGASVYDAEGRFLGDGRDLGGTSGINAGRAAISVVADIDLDGTPEIIAGPTVYRLVNGTLTVVWQRTDLTDGLTGVGNFDDDPFAEIVLVSAGRAQMLNHDGSNAEVWNPPSHGPINLTLGGNGGAPTIADVDGDGMPEIGIAGISVYAVYERDGKVRWF